jgi:ribonuclease PH
MNIVMENTGKFIEVQGTAEGAAFSMEQLHAMLDLGRRGIEQLFEVQNRALAN